MALRTVSLDDLTIDDEASFSHVEIYGRLADVLRRSPHRFHVPAPGTQTAWDRALLLNLTFWSGDEAADVLCEDHIPADVVAHVAWHHLAHRELARAGVGAPSPEALLFGESIASAFDLYLVGRLLKNVPDSDFITSQVPILSDVALQAGLGEAQFASLLEQVSEEPERAFEDLRALLLDVSRGLLACTGALAADRVLDGFAGHRFEPLLHHYQLSNWILYARAYAVRASEHDEIVRRLDVELRQSTDSLAWLEANWVDRAPV